MGRVLKKFTVILLFLFLLADLTMPLSITAQADKRKVVRVGWHEVPYFIKDEYGRQSGYSYEYQRKVAAYTGWDYEYVEGTWTELLQMLKEGKIDVLSDVSYSVERTKDMLFTSLPMGTESYYIFVKPDNNEIIPENISSIQGKRVGLAKGTIQNNIFREWLDEHDIEVTLIEMTGTEEESLKLLGSEFDAYITMDVYGTPETAVPIYKIGSSDFYFAVNKDRPDILTELDMALNKIQDENKYYAQQLNDKYLKRAENNLYLSNDEKKWLAGHGTIVVGYQDNYLAFCASDQSTGALTGALKDYLEYASKSFKNVNLTFRPVAYATAADALEALRKGEIDCMFPVNLTDFDAEAMDLIITPPLMSTEMAAVVRASEQKEFLRKNHVTVAVNNGNTNYDIYLADHYPNWKRVYYKDTPTGLNAVANGKADCVIISCYRYGNISKQCEKLNLTMVNTGEETDYCIAVCEGNVQLYSILARVIGYVPETVVHTALTYYSTEDVKTSVKDIIKENILIIMSGILIILMIILILILRSIRAEKKVIEEKRLVKTLNKRVFIDSLTSARNKSAFSEYIQMLEKRLDAGKKCEFAVIIYDCNDLKKINDYYGHDKGDIYLITACRLISNVFQHSQVYRIGGDEFAVILQNEDYDNRDKLIKVFEDRSIDICGLVDNKWEEVNVASGMAVYDPQTDSSANDVVMRADKLMYEDKRYQKKKTTVEGKK